MPTHTFDILIAGYGPAGATFANLMARRGYSVGIIEPSTEVYPKPRAITADHEALRTFQECGLADAVTENTRPHPGTDFVGMDGSVIKRFYPAPPPHPLAWEPSWMFLQPELEARLRQGLQRYPHVTEWLGHELLRAEERDGLVTASVRRLDTGDTLELRGRYLIGCDGGRSTVRRQLDAPIEDLAFDEWWIVVDAWIRGPVELPERCVQYCRPERPGTYIVGPADLRRWEIKILPGETPEMFQDDDKILEALGHFVDTRHVEVYRVAVYRFHALVVESWRQGRIFLMGDAAHQMPPFMGQGLCAAVRDAVNLAWKIDGVERLGYDDRLLSTYGEERKPHVRTVVDHAKSFGLIIGELDPDKARQRDAELSSQLAAGTAETIRQNFIPPLTNGLIADTAGSGELFVQPWLRVDGQDVRLDDVVPTTFWVVASEPALLAEWIDDATAGLLDRLQASCVCLRPGPVSAGATPVPFEEKGDLLTPWLQARQARVAIVRPDKYVYGLAAASPASP